MLIYRFIYKVANFQNNIIVLLHVFYIMLAYITAFFIFLDYVVEYQSIEQSLNCILDASKLVYKSIYNFSLGFI